MTVAQRTTYKDVLARRAQRKLAHPGELHIPHSGGPHVEPIGLPRSVAGEPDHLARSAESILVDRSEREFDGWADEDERFVAFYRESRSNARFFAVPITREGSEICC